MINCATMQETIVGGSYCSHIWWSFEEAVGGGIFTNTRKPTREDAKCANQTNDQGSKSMIIFRTTGCSICVLCMHSITR